MPAPRSQTYMATVTPPPRSSTSWCSDDPRVAEALEEYLNLCRQGRRPEREAFLARHEEIRPALTECLDGLNFLQSAVPDVGVTGGDLGDLRSEAEPLSPQTILGDFRLVREVGRGGMGIVFEADQVSLGRRVALKVLPFAASLDPRQRHRFQMEAQAAACLHHSHIVPVYAVGCDRGTHYYAMQYIEGKTLADLIAELRALEQHKMLNGERPPAPGLDSHSLVPSLDATRSYPSHSSDESSLKPDPDQPTFAPAITPMRTENGSAPPASRASSSGTLSPGGSSSSRSRAFVCSVARLGVQAAEALEHAHGLGILHRDIKPSNLMVDARGALWITDFGLARFHDDMGLTRTGDVLGTLRYMSPEQAQARHGIVDQRADIYSLGTTMYEVLALRPAFEGRDRNEVMRQIVESDPVPPRKRNPAVPRDLETVILKSMAKDPSARYASAQEMADDLNRFLDDKPIQARRPNVFEHVAKWAKRHRAVLATALVMLVLGLAGGLAFFWSAEQRAKRDRDLISKTLEDRDFVRQRERHSIPALLDAIDRWGFDLMGMAAYGGVLRGEAGNAKYKEAIALYEKLARTYENDESTALREIAVRGDRRAGFFRMILQDGEASDCYRRAIVLMNQIADTNAGEPRHRAELADVLGEFGNWLWMTDRQREAEPNLRQSIAILSAMADENTVDPGYVTRVVQSQLAHVARLERAGQSAEAVALVRSVMDRADAIVSSNRNPKVQGEILVEIGKMLMQRQRRTEALDVFTKAQHADPSNAEALKHAAWILVCRRGDQSPSDPARGLILAQAALRLLPEDTQASRALALARYRTGDFAGAEASIESALSHATRDDPLGLLIRALVSEAQGRHGEAIESFNSAAKLIANPNMISPELDSLRREASQALGLPEPTKPGT